MERAFRLRLMMALLVIAGSAGCSGTAPKEKTKVVIPPPPIPGQVGPGVGGAPAPTGMPGGAPVQPR